MCAVEMSYMRGACGVNRWDGLSNESVYENLMFNYLVLMSYKAIVNILRGKLRSKVACFCPTRGAD